MQLSLFDNECSIKVNLKALVISIAANAIIVNAIAINALFSVSIGAIVVNSANIMNAVNAVNAIFPLMIFIHAIPRKERRHVNGFYR